MVAMSAALCGFQYNPDDVPGVVLHQLFGEHCCLIATARRLSAGVAGLPLSKRGSALLSRCIFSHDEILNWGDEATAAEFGTATQTRCRARLSVANRIAKAYRNNDCGQECDRLTHRT